jgi:hypothetical protein
MTIRRRNKSGTYYFRFFWQNKEISRSLFTKDYHQAKKSIRELEKIVVAKLKTQPTGISVFEVHKLFDDYFDSVILPRTEQAIKSKTERLKSYTKNNLLNDLDIGIITELKVIKELLTNFTDKGSEEKIVKKLKSFSPQIKPIIPEYQQYIHKDYAYNILLLHQ